MYVSVCMHVSVCICVCMCKHRVTYVVGRGRASQYSLRMWHTPRAACARTVWSASMCVWVCVCVCVWVCVCGVWVCVCGCVGVWVLGCVGVWVCGVGFK
jgi:hypothetical protein